MNQVTILPTPSKKHATCAWCRKHFESIIELIDHVDAGHVDSDPREERRDAALAA
jgi:hypothetical protein